MRESSSMPAVAFFLDGEAAISKLRALADSLLNSRPDVMKVYLFGSLAKGMHVPGSDADLLIVLGEDERRMVDRIPEYLRAFLDAPVPVDVFPLTKREIADRMGRGDPFLQRALDVGILLSGQGHLTNSGREETLSEGNG